MFTYRKAGPSGRGEGRTRYYVDLSDEMGIRYIGNVEGKAGDWSLDVRGGPRFKSRNAAACHLRANSEKPKKPQKCSGRHDFGVLGEFAVYPGHPVTLALVLVRTHEDFADTNSYSEGFAWPHGVGCSAVPGAGGNVYAAMDLLVGWARGWESLEKLFERADQMWAHCDGQKEGARGYTKTEEERQKYIKRWEEGQAQADRFKTALVQALQTWPKGQIEKLSSPQAKA